MTPGPGPELVLIRHAPAEAGGRLVGRTDVPACALAPAVAARLRAALPEGARRVASPALRCRQTAAALWPDGNVETDERLREQDFGAWDGLPLGEIPDLGPLHAADLAQHRPPGGESFGDLCARVWPALTGLAATGGPVVVMAHAGTVRAALALALGDPGAALGFEVAPLSITRLRVLRAGGLSIACVNCAAA